MLAGALLLRPVAAITAGMAALAAGGAARDLEVGGGDELTALALQFNELSQRISSDRAQWEDERGQFMGIFHSIRDAVLLVDADGRLLFSNQEAQARLDLPAGGVAEGRSLEAMLSSQHPLVNLIGTARETGSDLRDVAMGLGLGPDEERMTFLVSIFRLGRDGSRAGQLIIVRDLDSVQHLQDVVEHSGRLARLSGLISGVAHQIRNPLNAMTLELELLRQDARNSGIIEERVRSVRAEMDHLGQAIEALMRFMRPERLQLAETDVNDLVAEIGRSIADPLVEVRCALDPSQPALIADRAVLGEALRNVAQNGVEAMAEGGVLTLTSRCAGDDVEIAVADTGTGISSEDLEHIFQLYFTTKEDGTGVGLSLALRAVDLHGGRMNVDSKIGEGTVVTISLPLKNGIPMTAASK
jgi:signal transduction histidine kinase